jgi:hypothetical protein
MFKAPIGEVVVVRTDVVVESLRFIATNLDATLTSGEAGEAAGASTKPENEGALTTKGRKEKAAQAVPKSSAKSKAPGRKARGSKNGPSVVTDRIRGFL